MSDLTLEERMKRLEQLLLGGPLMLNGKSFSIETLLDALVVLYDECVNSSLRKEKTISNFIDYAKPVVQNIKNLRLTKDDFEILKVIGRGAFGEVAVVKQKTNGKIYAMKILNKWEMLKRAETACFQEEREVLVHGDKRWITNLHYSFQDDSNLYLVMDYYCGGDLLTLLSKFEDRLPEDMAKFYITEMILAIDCIHKLNYVHRDIKPDNVLLDANGHIRLADFGSCLKLLEDGTVQSNVAVGTPDYISPEILRAMEDGQGKYGPECDWWSLGVCMYEMLYGETPFYAESLVETYGKIMNHKNCFDFPEEPAYNVSEEAKDLMRRLICTADSRFGQNGLDDFKNHPWFAGINWDNIRDSEAPYIPEVSSPTDTSNFDVDEADFKSSDSVPPSTNSIFSGLHLPFVGFTFTCGSKLSCVGISSASSHDQVDIENHNLFQQKIEKLEQEKRDLLKKVYDSAKNHKLDLNEDIKGIKSNYTESEIRKLQDEVNTLKKKNSEMESELRKMYQQREIINGRQELDSIQDDKSLQYKEMEKSLRYLKTEKEDIHRDLIEAQEKLKLQSKEIKDALAQRKLAMTEYTEISDKLLELRAQKQKLSRQVRDKEEELENSLQKIDTLRQDLRKADKLRRELEARIEDAKSDIAKERRMKERSDEYARHLEEEMESLKQRHVGWGTSPAQLEATQEINRLKLEIESVELQHKEILTQQQSRYNAEMTNLLDQLQETECTKETLEKEIMTLKEKIEQTRTDSSIEHQEALNEIRRAHECEKQLLQDDNRKLALEVERITELINRQQEDRRRLEDDIIQIREKKESVSQWEAQISEIIQWVSDEKDARGYLQALATKMTEELENLKMSGVISSSTIDKNWRNRRSQKLDKMELLSLQSSLQSEIQAKQAVSEELSHVRAELIAHQKELRDYQQKLDAYRKDNQKKESKIRELQQRLDSGEGFFDRPSSQMSFLDQFLKDTSQCLARSESGDSAEAGDEADVEDNQPPSVASSKSNVSEDRLQMSVSPVMDSRPEVNLITPKPKAHQFLVRTFVAPLKCNHCTSLMVGIIRQGAVCEVCGFACHVSCQDKVPAVCPVPADQTKRPVGIDPTRGIGTAYEGYVKVPKPGGVKKGWMRQFVVVCDFKLFLYDLAQDKNAQPYVSVSQVLDMRDEDFSVSSVLESDVIHANKKDIPCIFRVTTSMMNPPDVRNHMLMLVDRESEKTKWVDALSELHRILRRNKLPTRMVYQAKELLDNTITIIKNALSAAVIDYERFALGTEEGLYCIDLDCEDSKLLTLPAPALIKISKVGDGKKISQIEYIAEEQLLIVIAGKQRHLKLIPVGALDGLEVEWIKVTDTKGCIAFCTVCLCKGSVSTYVICVAFKRQVIMYEINRLKGRHQKRGDITLPGTPQCLDIIGDKLCVGFQSSFCMYSLRSDTAPVCLINSDCSSLSYLAHNAMDALVSVELSNNEYLLVFTHLGVYVDSQGKKTRERELMFPAIPVAVSVSDGYLCTYSETHIDVFEIATGDWIQTISLKKAKPLCRTGIIGFVLAADLPHIIYLHNIHFHENLIRVPEHGGGQLRGRTAKAVLARTRRRFSMREPDKTNKSTTDRRSRIISGPTNFNHISHMGPGQGIQLQKLIDIPKAQQIVSNQDDKMQQTKQVISKVSNQKSHPVTELHQVMNTVHQASNGVPLTKCSIANYSHGHRPPSSLTAVSPDGSLSSQEHSIHSLSHQTVGSGHDEQSSPRHSIASNNSSTLSSPPSPGEHRDQGSSSYESQS
ncbi:serine/threonine-protein kinase Genghis Khan-like isoform X5 [Centruroides vittatus]|uniref:serine/threonine-protein kinase Genghis Khan-like isoform X5 n=1 Tax=Centruroides vittatus TaxID=120091 RepID=UPI003510A36B